ncbi:MAG: hypothetical protein KC431_14780 [Myxococcales bacterium]|nr:hypothetical protein [Myxococcales bacterium]
MVSPPVWLVVWVAVVMVLSAAIVQSWPRWRFRRVALEELELPDTGSPFRAIEQQLRARYVLTHDTGSTLSFSMHALLSLLTVLGFAALGWAAMRSQTFVEFAPAGAATAALLAALLAWPMWLGRRRLHGTVGVGIGLAAMVAWAPALPFVGLVVLVEQALMRRRSEADAHESRRRRRLVGG